MYHDVEREPLPFFLREANLKKRSGHLFVSAKDFQITLNLLEGKLANGMSTRFDEKLSVILHLMGRINEEQYNFLSGLHQFSDDQVAGILLDQNFAKKRDIFYARVYQLRRIAISIFALQQGKWIFTAGEADPPLRETFDIPLAGILVEGARSVDHVSAYAGRWQHCVPVLFKEIPLDAEIYYTEAEREFYAAVQAQGRRSCQELIARLNLVPIEFWRNLLAFHLLGIVEFEKSEAASDLSGEIAALLELNRRLQESPAAGAALLGLAPSASAADFEKARAGLLARFAPERFGSGAAPEIKSIARAVCLHLQELMPRREAWPDMETRPGLRREAEIVSEPYLAETRPGLLHEGEIIVERPAETEPRELREQDIVVEPSFSGAESEPEVEEDIVILSSPAAAGPGQFREEDVIIEPSPAEAEPMLLRGDDVIPESAAAARPGLPDSGELIVDAEEQAGPGLLREEDIVIESPLGSEPELLGDAERIEEPELLSDAERISEPEALEAVTPPPEAAAEFEPLRGADWIVEEDEPSEGTAGERPAAAPLQVEPEIPAAPPAGEFAPVAAPPSLRMASADHEKAWELLLQAKDFYEKHEPARAVPLLKKAIKLESNQGDFYYLLGICQSEEELSKNEAEMNLKKAIELKSWSADPVYALGVLYRGQGKMKLAERCFQRVKEIAYEHTGASRALVDLRRQKSTGKPSPLLRKKRS
jgi:tetratricopeptide (TPR) repeat protein